MSVSGISIPLQHQDPPTGDEHSCLDISTITYESLRSYAVDCCIRCLLALFNTVHADWANSGPSQPSSSPTYRERLQANHVAPFLIALAQICWTINSFMSTTPLQRCHIQRQYQPRAAIRSTPSAAKPPCDHSQQYGDA